MSKESLVGREGGVLFTGANADGSANATRVEAEQFYTQYRSTNIATPFVYNGSFVRWRSLSIGYDFSRFVKSTFIKRTQRIGRCQQRIDDQKIFAQSRSGSPGIGQRQPAGN